MAVGRTFDGGSGGGRAHGDGGGAPRRRWSRARIGRWGVLGDRAATALPPVAGAPPFPIATPQLDGLQLFPHHAETLATPLHLFPLKAAAAAEAAASPAKMSGGFFRGTSADQDTRFSNKQAKLLKTQKFAPELEHLVDMTKVKMDVMKPWIATRVTELLGFEDEVLINFIYGLLEEKEADGKKIQIQLTGFMEKNTVKFMKELWSLLLSAQQNASGVPQQFLDAKEAEIQQKKAEESRIAQEIQKKREKDGREQELEKQKLTDGDAGSSRLGPDRADAEEEKELDSKHSSRPKSRTVNTALRAWKAVGPRASPCRLAVGGDLFLLGGVLLLLPGIPFLLGDNNDLQGAQFHLGAFSKKYPFDVEAEVTVFQKITFGNLHYLGVGDHHLHTIAGLQVVHQDHHLLHAVDLLGSGHLQTGIGLHLQEDVGLCPLHPDDVGHGSLHLDDATVPFTRKTSTSPHDRSPIHSRRSLSRDIEKGTNGVPSSNDVDVLQRNKERARDDNRNDREATGHFSSDSEHRELGKSLSFPNKPERNLARDSSLKSTDKHLPSQDRTDSSGDEEGSRARENARKANSSRRKIKDFSSDLELKKAHDDLSPGEKSPSRSQQSGKETRRKQNDQLSESSEDERDGRRTKHTVDSPDDSQQKQHTPSRVGMHNSYSKDVMNSEDAMKGLRDGIASKKYPAKVDEDSESEDGSPFRKDKRKAHGNNHIDSGSSASEESGKHRSHSEKRKHKKSRKHKRRYDDSSDESNSESDDKESKRRRKEEKRLRKEERRRRREERHRRKADRQASKLKLKHAETVDMASDLEKDCESDSDADVRKKGSYIGREESDQQKLEIELREKALESLRAKKAINH
uniref:PWI domain-containing protein n=1 Tax=Oryza punctata TaxID=4537 RepID=A0A0E0KBU6_ORYPU